MADMERTLMQGKLAQARADKARLVMKLNGLCTIIRQGLNPLLLAVEEMDIAQAAGQMDELLSAHIDLLDITTQIQRLERALHG